MVFEKAAVVVEAGEVAVITDEDAGEGSNVCTSSTGNSNCNLSSCPCALLKASVTQNLCRILIISINTLGRGC